MEKKPMCPQCGAEHPDGATCQEDFHQMLFWEAENPANGVVHNLMVLSYHLQHPRLYSPDGLKEAKSLLVDFVERGLSPEQVREERRPKVDSSKRQWKVTARPGLEGSYAQPVRWTMTAGDVVAAGEKKYIDSVRAWAQSIDEALRVSGELS